MIRKNLAVSATGNRKVDGFVPRYGEPNSVGICNHLRGHIISLINNGYRDFISGCALGSDTLYFFVVDEVRNMPEFRHLDIKNILAIPYVGFNSRWSSSDIMVFNRMLHLCDEFYIVDQIPNYYINDPIQKLHRRNHFMVDNSDVLLVVSDNGSYRSGTRSCINYANKNNKYIIN